MSYFDSNRMFFYSLNLIRTLKECDSKCVLNWSNYLIENSGASKFFSEWSVCPASVVPNG